MKKIIKLVLSIAGCLALVGTSLNAVKANGASGYYSGSGTGYNGGNIVVMIEVEKNASNETVLKSVSNIQGDQELIGASHLGTLKTQIEAHIGESINNTYTIDGVSGATFTSNGVREALASAQVAAQEFNPEPQPKPQPEPTPSPSEPAVKDERCEVVIGPSWHWNETKGVCEEYATVGTSTK